MTGYNFAYLDEQTKRMIRRAILKAVAIPGHQVPFGAREMPLPYGWGTGGIQVTAAILGADDVLKVIDQGADDTTNAVSIRRFFARTAGVATTTRTRDATIIQTRDAAARGPDPRLSGPAAGAAGQAGAEPCRDPADACARRIRADACEAL
jgi:alpha-D-ribose 1-methylphosphonate 5-phosphate C-P lyase